MGTDETKLCGMGQAGPVNRQNPKTKLTKQAGVDRVGGVDTRAKGDRVCGLARPNRDNPMTKL